MVPAPRNGLRLFVLTLAVSLIASVILALACGPASPAGQGATPEPTATAEPTATPAPVADPDKLNPVAKALLALHAAPTPGASQASSADGAQSTIPTPAIAIPRTVTLHISTLSLEATRDFLESNNGAIEESETVELANNWVIVSEAPLALLPALSQQPDTLYAVVDGPYRNLPGHLNRLVTEYAAERLTQTRAAGPEPEPILASVRVTDAGYANVRRFLQSHGVPPTYKLRRTMASLKLAVSPN